MAWPGLCGSAELVGPAAAATGPSPLQIWWGHKAMIMDLALSPTNIVAKSDQQQQTRHKEFMIEKYIATASDDTTVRIYTTENLTLTC